MNWKISIIRMGTERGIDVAIQYELIAIYIEKSNSLFMNFLVDPT